jgi:WD40 repeat protein
MFPAGLRWMLGSEGEISHGIRDVEPICADFREEDSKTEVSQKTFRSQRPLIEYQRLKLIAGVLGVGFDELAQRDKERQRRIHARRVRVAVSLALLFAGIALAAIVFGVKARKAEQSVRLAAAQAEFDVATPLLEENARARTVAHLARALRAKPDYWPAAERLCFLLQSPPWSIPITPPVLHGGEHPEALFSPDRSQLLTYDWSGDLKLWDSRSMRLLSSNWSQSVLQKVSFSPDGKFVATAGLWASLWNTTTFEHSGDAIGSSDAAAIDIIRFSKDSGLLLTCGRGDSLSEIRVTQLEPRTLLFAFRRPKERIKEAEFNGDARKIALITGPQSLEPNETGTSNVIVLATMNGQLLKTIPTETRTAHVRFTRDDQQLLITEGNRLRGFNTATWQPEDPKRESVMDDGPLPDLASNDLRFITALKDGTFRISVPGREGAIPVRFDTPETIIGLHWSRQDKKVRLITDQGSRYAWTQGQTTPKQPDWKTKTRLDRAWFEPSSGDVVLVGHHWEAPPIDLRAQINGNGFDPPIEVGNGLVVWRSGDGRQIATLTKRSTVSVWNLDRHTLVGSVENANSAFISPDGQWIVCMEEETDLGFRRSGTSGLPLSRRAVVTHVATGKALGKPLTHDATITMVRFSSDGHYLALCAGSVVRVWRMPSLQPVGRLLQHPATVTDAAFSPDGLRIATACADSKIRFWEVETGRLVSYLAAPDTKLTALSFSPDGTQLATSGDKTALIWNLPANFGPVPPWFIDFAESIGEFRFGDGSILEIVPQTPHEVIRTARSAGTSGRYFNFAVSLLPP